MTVDSPEGLSGGKLGKWYRRLFVIRVFRGWWPVPYDPSRLKRVLWIRAGGLGCQG